QAMCGTAMRDLVIKLSDRLGDYLLHIPCPKCKHTRALNASTSSAIAFAAVSGALPISIGHGCLAGRGAPPLRSPRCGWLSRYSDEIDERSQRRRYEAPSGVIEKRT